MTVSAGSRAHRASVGNRDPWAVGGIDDGEHVHLLGAGGPVAVPEVKEELAGAALVFGAELEGHDGAGLICGFAVLDHEELVLRIFLDLAGVDPVPEGGVWVDEVVLTGREVAVWSGSRCGEHGGGSRQKDGEELHLVFNFEEDCIKAEICLINGGRSS